MRQPSTWISAVVTLVCGGLLGLLTTVAHRAVWTIGGWPAPIGIVLGALGAVAFVGACRLLWDGRIPAVGAALGVILAPGVLVLMPDVAVFYGQGGFDAIDAWWTFLPDVLVLAVVLWPAGRPMSASADRIEGPANAHPGDRQ